LAKSLENVPCKKEGMDTENFKLKVQTVYYVIDFMCIGFCVFFMYVMVAQDEVETGFFKMFLVGLIVSLVVLLDFATDKFSVDGDEVVRRRFFSTKRFKLSEVGYVKESKNILRENLEFYINDKCVTRVWMKNRPFDMLESRLAQEKIRRRI